MPKPSEMAAQAAQKSAERKRIRVDISDYYGEPEGTTVYEYEEMSVPQLYRGFEAQQGFREKHRDFPDSLVSEVMNLALTHVSPPMPDSTSKTEFYAGLTRDAMLWITLTGKYREARGKLVEDATGDAKKNSSGATRKTPTSGKG